MRRKMKDVLGRISKYCKLYIVYIICIIISFILYLGWRHHLLETSADFTAAESDEIEDDVQNVRTVYNYFLDFSPSMKGFFDENINSHMHVIAELFEQINADSENNRFYWCSNSIETVPEPTLFYTSMKTEQSLLDYYENIIQTSLFLDDTDTEEAEESDTALLNDMELSKIFTESYADPLSEDEDNLNIMITDMNFLQDQNNVDIHNRRMETLAGCFGESVSNKNVCIYAITTNYAGAMYDEAAFETNTDVSAATFYLIVFSDRDEAYRNYCERLESYLDQRGISLTGKFELLNDIHDSEEKLTVTLNTYKNLEMVRNNNINFANGLFNDLDANEFAVQIVSGSGKTGTLEMPVSEISLSGYYKADTKGYDDTRVDVEAELYHASNKVWQFHNDYEVYDDTSMILGKTAGIYYDDGIWYLQMNITMDTDFSRYVPDSWIKRLLEKEYMVLNLKFYMIDPSYSKPEWIDMIDNAQAPADGMMNIGILADEIIKNKERAYASQPLEDRYLGNIVIYILY